MRVKKSSVKRPQKEGALEGLANMLPMNEGECRAPHEIK